MWSPYSKKKPGMLKAPDGTFKVPRVAGIAPALMLLPASPYLVAFAFSKEM
jgi:hypothetical protein